MTAEASLPAFFAPLLAEQYGADDVSRIVEGCSARRHVTLRANALRATRAEVANDLEGAGIAFDGIGWYDDAFVIRREREDAIRELATYRDGGLYLQSLSSMIPALVLAPGQREDICDMCAAPGGKTSQIAALTGNKAYITACEMHPPRAEKLEHNLKKLGASNVTVMRADARRLDEFFSFDRILLDAPCSGSGTLRLDDPRMPKRFTPALVQKSQKSQRALMLKALEMLKPGATLVYSTCSVLVCENEDIVEGCLKSMSRKGSFELQPIGEPASGEPDRFDADALAELPLLPTRLEGALCIAPTELYEGFFVAKVRRTA